MLILAASFFLMLADFQPAKADRHTPQAAYQALIDAIDREDEAVVADSVIDAVDLKGEDRALEARRIIITSKLDWIIRKKFGEDALIRASSLGYFAGVIRLMPDDLVFRPARITLSSRKEIVEQVQGESVRGNGEFTMSRLGDNWYLDHSIGAFLLAWHLENAEWQNHQLQQVLEQLEQQKITNVSALYSALRITPTTFPPTTRASDRTTPPGTLAAIHEAIERGDQAAVEDCFVQHGIDIGEIRALAAHLIDIRKLNVNVHQRFDALRADQLVTRCELDAKRELMLHESVGWQIDGDVARGVRQGGQWALDERMLRHDGKWRVELTPYIFGDAAPKLERDARRDACAELVRESLIIRDILDHPAIFPDPASVTEALRTAGDDFAKQQAYIEAQRQRRLAEIIRESREPKNPDNDITARDRTKMEIDTSIERQLLETRAEPEEFPPSIFVTAGDRNGEYAIARTHRRAVANKMMRIASLDLVDEPIAINDFGLSDAVDKLRQRRDHQWNIAEDLLSARLEDQEGNTDNKTGGSSLTVRKVGSDWKIDLSEETDGNPAAAAVRAEREALAISKITGDLRSNKILTGGQLRDVLKAANICGTGKPGQ